MLEGESRLLLWEANYLLIPNVFLLLTCWEATWGIMLNSIQFQEKPVQF